jgi:TrmH family RNA methyltransferase
MEITSLQNQRVKDVVRLREDRRQREREGVMLVEGTYEIELALASGMRPREVYHCPELSSASFPELEPVSVTRAVLEKMAYRENPEGWLAVFPTPQHSIVDLHLPANPLLVLAESVEKPGNLGAILRTADAAGADGLIVADPRVDLYNPNVVRASRGTLFTVQTVTASGEDAIRFLHERNIRVLAATPAADALYTDVDLSGPVCIAVGTEDEGLTDFWMEQADLKVKIPMKGKVNSLNVSIAAALFLYEALRQRNSH